MDENNINDRDSERLTGTDDYTGTLPDLKDFDDSGVLPYESMDVDELLEDARMYAEMEPLERTPQEQPEPFRDEAYRDTFGTGEELRQLLSDEPQEPEKPEQSEPEDEPIRRVNQAEEIPMRKGRPKRKDRYGMLGIPHILVTCFWLVIVIAIGVSMGRVIWVCASDVLAFGREEKIVEVRINNEDTLNDITNKLYDAGLIRYPGLFKLYAGFTDAREDIGSGNFELNTLYDYHALVDSMNNYSFDREKVTVQIPEGYTCAQIFKLLEEKGVCSVEDLENYAKDGELDEYWFLEGVDRGSKYSLEGFLFPDTYEFYVNTSAKRVLEKLLDNFETKFDEKMQEKVEALNERFAARLKKNGYSEEYIQEHKLSLRDVITIASMIEKETAGNDESYDISSVIYNRLSDEDKWPYLNIDAALLYAIGHREEITAEDKNADTPYNTYKYPGLIPGPIANPGINSMKAALEPNDTGYYFYALDPDSGEHHFSKNLEEHNAFLESIG